MSYKISALALALFASTAHANYSNVVYIGDSLSDAGYFAPITQGKLGLAESGKFTTNPDGVWTDRLATHLNANNTAQIGYANQTGNNHAVGGARAGVDFVNETFGVPVPSAKTQVATYLAQTTPDGNALHSVWIGANDLFAASADPANAQATILSAVADASGVVGALHQAGANYILLPTLPDVGLTPDFVGKPTASTATATAKLYNDMLITQATATGANVIPLDMFGLLQEVAQNPSGYGIDNMTDKACGETSSLVCGQNNVAGKANYFFADGVHPTAKAHRMIGDYAYQTATAPSQIGTLSHLTSLQGLATDGTVRTNAKQNTWLSVQKHDGTLGNWQSDDITSVMLGKALHQSDKTALGVYLGHTGASYKATAMTADMDETAVGVYHAGNLAGFDTYAQAGLGVLGVDTARTVALDTYRTLHKAEAKGKRFGATVGIAKPLAFGRATISPHLSATAQSIRLGQLNENSQSATALHFDEQKHQSVYGKVGLEVGYQVGKFKVNGDVYYQDQLSGKTPTPSASLATLPVRFATPKADLDDKGYGASLGVSAQLTNLTLGAGVRYYRADHDDLMSVGVSVGKRF